MEGSSQESDADKIARLEAENSELQAKAEALAEAGSAAAAEVPESSQPTPILAPLQALAASVEANPNASFVQHLEKLAADGVKAVISPSVAEDVHSVIAALVADLVKVKL